MIDANNVPCGAISPLKYRPTDDGLVSFVEMPIDKKLGKCEIREVILGPKNRTSEDTLHHFLETHDFPNAIIKRSGIPYRCEVCLCFFCWITIELSR